MKRDSFKMGKQYGSLTVVAPNKRRKTDVFCFCACGSMTSIPRKKLKEKQVTMCKHCEHVTAIAVRELIEA